MFEEQSSLSKMIEESNQLLEENAARLDKLQKQNELASNLAKVQIVRLMIVRLRKLK
jgi:hypothetical protein